MRSKPLSIRYHFLFDDGTERAFEVQLDPRSLMNLATPVAPLPAWTKLDLERCSNCPLRSPEHPDCPTAARVAGLVQSFSDVMSFTTATVRVQLRGREVTKRTSVQEGLSALLGIHMTTSGCPVLAKLRPMVRFHQPFSSEDETIFRAASTYLFGQYVRSGQHQSPDWSMAGLVEVYEQIGTVNRAFARRLRHAVVNDANVNALVVLDAFAKAMPDTIDDRLKEFSEMYSAWD